MKFLFSIAFIIFQLFVVLAAPVKNFTSEHTISKRTYVPPDLIYYYIYFTKPENWGEKIYSYVYTEEENLKDSISYEWPGEEIHRLGESNNYYISYPEKLYGHSYIIFTDGKNQSPGVMQKGFDLVKNAVYTVDGISGIFENYDSDKNYEISYRNYALIYYHPTFKSFSSYNIKLYVHYINNDGKWTDIEMSKNPYTNFFIAKIDLGDAVNITFSITDGKDTSDNNNGQYYKFKKFENIYIKSDVSFC